MKYESKSIGRCVTEYKLIGFEETSMKCVLFFTVPQFRNVEGFSFEKLEELNIQFRNEMGKCGVGQKLYGVLPDRSIVRLVEIVDSSD